MSGKKKDRSFYKDYEKVSVFLKRIFYYGAQSQSDFEDICKKSEFYDYKKTLRYVFGDGLIEEKNAAGKPTMRLRTDHLYDPHIAFLRFFALKSFTSSKRLLRIIYILQRLSRDGELTAMDIEAELNEIELNNPEGDAKEVGSSVKRLLDDMTKNGLLAKEGSRYYIDYPAERLKDCGAAMLVDFCTNVYPLSICGNGLLSKIDLNYQSPFLFKRRYLGRIFDDEIIWKLVASAYEKRPVRIIRKGKEPLRDLLPYRIITNRETGRQYVFVIYVGDKDYDEYLLLRLDRIKSVELEEKEYAIPDDETLAEKYETAFKYSFNGSAILQRGEKTASGIIEYKPFFEREIKRLFPDCTPENTVDECKRIRVTVNSFTELKPWLRRNLDKVRLVESSDGVVDEMREELEKWREMYGIIRS